MPEKKRSGQIALLVASAVLLASILTFVFYPGTASDPAPGAAPDSDGPGKSARLVTLPEHSSSGSSKERIEKKLAQALSPKFAANDPEARRFFQPPRTRIQPDRSGGFPALTAPVPNEEPLNVILNYLQSEEPGKARDQGWTGADFTEPLIMNEIRSRRNGVSHLYLRQQVEGIEVYNGNLNANVAKDGSLLSLHNGFVKEVAAQINRRQPLLSAAEAIESAANHVQAGIAVNAENLEMTETPEGPAQAVKFEGGALSHDPIPAKLVYVAQPGNDTRLAWNLVMHLKDGVRWLDLTIDAENGKLLTQANWYANADYQVFAQPKEHPNDGPRTLESDPHDPASSPFGWHDTDGAAGAEFNTTQGNNVYAQEDTDASNSGGRRPNGGAGLIFNHAIDLATQAPPAYEDAAITNLFYWNNLIHDVLWHHGFDEASGNFQQNNYGAGGVAGDPVQADAQDGSGTNNANFGTPPDGQDPRMQMFVWTRTPIDRDSDLDNGIIIHEYGHGVSNRLTGGAANSSALNQSQSRGMGEGWSDWWALTFTAVATDTATTQRGIGTYVLGEPIAGPGIRPYRYTTDMGVNPQTFGDLDDGGLSVPHGIGSVWCTTLWEVYWGLVGVHGWDPNLYTGTGGNNIAMRLVLDGMKLQPANPTFLEARDAIILADQVNNGGANFGVLWQAFAKRGMGYSAVGDDASSLNVTEAFDIPDEAFSVTDVTIAEGDSGSVNAVFTVSLDDASPDEEIRVNYATENGSASAPGDFTAPSGSGQLIYPAGTTVRTVTVPVIGDMTPEEDETFILRLSNPINAVIGDDAGVGTILNDDYIPPVINSSLTAAGADGIPFSYAIEADNTPRSFSIGGTIPQGVTVDINTGLVSWPSPVMGSYAITITATNPLGSDTETLAIEIAQNPLLTALDIENVAITSSTIPWFSQTAVTQDQVDAAQSGDITDNQSSWMETIVAGPDTVFFWWKVSSEANYDYLSFYLNGALNREIDGEVDWQKIQIDLPAGNHTLRWEYSKDGSVSTGSDAGWVDDLIIVSLDPRPFITSNSTAYGAKDQPFSHQIETFSPATSFSSDPLPAGLNLNPSTGLISGTPLSGSTTDVMITATNAAGSDSQMLHLAISEVASFPYSEDFEGGVIGPAWTISGTNEFRTEVTQSQEPNNGLWHMVMDDSVSGSAYSRNEATLNIDLSGQTGIFLSFWAKDLNDEPDGPPSLPFTDGADFDGVAVSDDGVTWYEVQPLRNEITNEWEIFVVNLDSVIATHGLSYSSNFKIRFNQYDNYSAPTDGIAIDDVTVGQVSGRADLTDASDSGISNSDNITNVINPVFAGTGSPGAGFELSSSIEGAIGSGTISGAGIWSLTSATLSEGIHEITVLEGGSIPSEVLTVIIDLTGPVISVNQAAGQHDATSEPVLDFSAVFDQPVVGFESGDVNLGGSLGPASAASITEVAPDDDTTFNIEVTGMPADGVLTVSVDAGAATDRAGNPNQASVSTDNSITFRFPADPPSGVTASDGEFTDKIRVAWDPVANADGGYRIYRHTADDIDGAIQIGATLPGNTEFNDNSALPGTSYFYWVNSQRIHAGGGEVGASDSGLRAADAHGDTAGTATDLGIPGSGSTTEAGVLERWDKDFFVFELEWRAHVKIYTTGTLDTVGTLLGSDGATAVNDPVEDADARPDGRNFEIDEVLDPGDYFVNVTGADLNQSGPYDLVFEIMGPLDFQPDRAIGKSPGSLKGNNYYSESGAGQTQTVVSKKLRKATYHGRVENDGNFADDLTMRGKRGTSLFRVTYFDSSGNVTAAMIAGTLVKSFEAGEGEATRVLVKPSRKLKNRSTKKIKRKKITTQIYSTSGMENTRKDVVKTVTKTR